MDLLLVDFRHEEKTVGQPELDPEQFLTRLKSENQVLRWEPLPPRERRPSSAVDPGGSRDSLDYLHAHWALPDTFDPSVAGAGLRGKLVGLFGRITYRVLGPYLRSERELLAHAVRVNDGLQRRCDALSARLEQVEEDAYRRQADEAQNLAKLALWLHLDPPASGTAPFAGDNGHAPGIPSSTS
jgi:hypothetical protein